MNDSFKYLTHNPDDEAWGLYLTVAGSACVASGTNYPPKGHPSGYHFSWEKGRILHEYQINYITEGEGIIETNQGEFEIKEGSVIIIKPKQWHRYKPLSNKGWKEHYIGFNGHFARQIFDIYNFSSDAPVIHIGFEENTFHAFQVILNLIKTEKPGYQQICSGLVIQILGTMVAIRKNKNLSNSKVETAIQKACLIIRENLNNNINLQEIAHSLDISYSLFRKAFKNYTGLSPVQYHLSLRIQQALYLLNDTSLSVKEISFKLGFCSVYYFSKIFKEKTKRNPSEFRRKNKLINEQALAKEIETAGN
jgi:AraC-like DNA-binding protein/mannose-6-phosphate isomerase-like protein (cupin superfamily)